MVCERGYSFGYNNLISDMRALAILRETACPVIFDATHSVQLPGGHGTNSGAAGICARVSTRCHSRRHCGYFMETHPDPDRALSDGPNSWPLAKMQPLLETLKELDKVVKNAGFLEQSSE